MVGRLARTWATRSLGALLVLAALASDALACPYCAAQDMGDGLGTLVVIGGMILFPFAVVGIAIPIIKRAGSEADALPQSRGGDLP